MQQDDRGDAILPCKNYAHIFAMQNIKSFEDISQFIAWHLQQAILED